MSHDRPPSDRQICALNTIGQFIDIKNIMPWLDVCFFFWVSLNQIISARYIHLIWIQVKTCVLTCLSKEKNIEK